MGRELIRSVGLRSLAVAGAMPPATSAQELLIYPDRGQSPQQQSRNRFLALGAVGEAIAGDASKRAAAGAATGGLHRLDHAVA